jgi:RNA polymerase sigma-70 factor (ECF subfamily)
VHYVAFGILKDSAYAEDVAQEVFLRLWLRPVLFDGQQKSLHPFLTVMARNRALDLYRRSRQELGTRYETEAAHDYQEDWILDCSARTQIEFLLPRPRVLLQLAYFEGMSHSEIAGFTGLPLGTVKDNIRRAVLQIRARVEGRDNSKSNFAALAAVLGPQSRLPAELGHYLFKEFTEMFRDSPHSVLGCREDGIPSFSNRAAERYHSNRTYGSGNLRRQRQATQSYAIFSG